MDAIAFMTLNCDLSWVIDDDEDHLQWHVLVFVYTHAVCVVVVETMNLREPKLKYEKRRDIQPSGSVYVYNLLELICETIERQPLLIRPVEYERLICVVQLDTPYTTTLRTHNATSNEALLLFLFFYTSMANGYIRIQSEDNTEAKLH